MIAVKTWRIKVVFLHASALLLVLMTSLAASSRAAEVFVPEIRIRIIGPPDQILVLRELAERASRELQDTLKRQFNPGMPVLEILVRGKDDTYTAGADALVLTMETPGSEAVHALVLRLLRRLEPNWQNAARQGRLDWLAAAVTRATLDGNRPVRQARHTDLAAAAIAVNTNPAFNLKNLVDLPIPPQQPLAYRVYALHCRLLITVLNTPPAENDSERNGVAALLQALGNGEETGAALKEATAAMRNENESVNDWYRRETANRDFAPAGLMTAEETRQRLDAVRMLPVAMPGERGKIQVVRVPLSEAPAALAGQAYDRRALAAKCGEILAIFLNSPLLIRPAINLYLQAFQQVQYGASNATFRRQLEQADKAFASALAKQLAVEKYLDQVNQAAGLANAGLPFYLYADHKKQQDLQQLAPALQRYLDTLLQP
jgi:hypothetical protein